MASLVLVFVCVTAGFLLRRWNRLPATAPAALNAFALNVALPALALRHFHEMPFSHDLWYPVGMAWLLFILGVIFCGIWARIRGLPPGSLGALILTAGLANTSFVGFPLLEALFGPESLRIGILADQPGSFLVMATLGVFTAATLAARSQARVEGGLLPKITRRVAGFLPLYAMLVALALRSWAYPVWFLELCTKLGDTLIPIALVSLGAQLSFRFKHLRARLPELAAGLFFKLLLAPALIAVLFLGVLGGRGQVLQVTIAEAAMAPMITGAVLATEYDLDPELANLMVTVGIPLSFVTVPLWAFFLKGF